MARGIEERSLNAWPALQNMVYDGWLLRFSNGYTKRANSINPIHFSSNDINDKIHRCEEVYREKGLETVYKITPFVHPADLDEMLAQRGYQIDSPTSVQTLDLKAIPEPVGQNITLWDYPSEAWLSHFFRLNNVAEKNHENSRKVMENVIPKKYFITLNLGNKVVGCGMAVIENGYVGLFDIVVDSEYRNQGYGRQVVLHLLGLGKQSGAQKAYLQVMLNNPPALKLYKDIGFKEVYQYWYRVK